MTIDLFAASFICRDADLDTVFHRMSAPVGVGRLWAAAWALVDAVLGRRSPLA